MSAQVQDLSCGTYRGIIARRRRRPVRTPKHSTCVPSQRKFDHPPQYSPSQDTLHRLNLPPTIIERQQRQLQHDPGRKDPEPAEEPAQDRRRGQAEDAEIDGEVEVWSGEGLEDGEAEEKVA